MAASALAADSPAAEVLEAWNEPPSAERDGDELAAALEATEGLGAPDVSRYRKLLVELIELFGAERAFLFEVADPGAEPPELGAPLAAVDLDGDPVPQPERKVPASLVTRVAAERVPLHRRRSESPRKGSLLALPAVSRCRSLAVVVLENRFQDLAADRRALRLARVRCQALGASLDLSRVAAENESLWKDLERLRHSRPSGPHVPARPVERPRGPIRSRAGLQGDYSMIVGDSPKMLEILQVIDRISGSNAPVLLNGDSGTGKELAALAVHNNSPRRGKTFVSENCGAITETLLESELFGYVKGAFTGATKDHKGLFELAIGGTLFLDEVGDMSPSMQKKLLRVLQEGVIRRVGAKDFTPVDVRIISATNKDLTEECRAGRFREDLYYRLNVINLRLPPLRERREDIPALVEHFLRELCEDTGLEKEIEPAALERLVQYSWPGNIRELQNEVRKLFALSDGPVIRLRDLSDHLRDEGSGAKGTFKWAGELAGMTLREATEELERVLIRRALEEHGRNKSQVAKALQIPKTSLYNKINKYGL